ncbi:MAG: alpha/beta hydrolase [Ferruginibacter sp.]|nr:alpha/beta hydrolase [Ferruginibacter sp.]
MQKKSFKINCAKNYQMPLYTWLPDNEPTAILFIIHGMAEYAQRYNNVATIIATNNIAVYACDIRAHGNAAANKNQLGIVQKNWFYSQIDDILIAIHHLKKEHPNKKIFLFGHSMGSFLCQRFYQLYSNEIDGLVLSASNGKIDPLMKIGIAIAYVQMKIFGNNHKSKLLNKLSFEKFNAAFKPNRTSFDWLSRNANEVDKYINDPMCGFVCSATFFYYFFKGIEDCLNTKNYININNNVPIYLFSGSKDPVGLFGNGFLKLVTNYKAVCSKNVSYNLYENGRHEMLNEINRDEVLANLISWIKTNC